jgi:hypothetical protein
MSVEDVTRDFGTAMQEIYRRAKLEEGYNASRFLVMLHEHGAVESARRLIGSPNPSEGFTTLVLKKRWDLTVEMHVLDPRFNALFSDDEREACRERLLAYGCDRAVLP